MAHNLRYELQKLLAPSNRLRYGRGMAPDSKALATVKEPGAVSGANLCQLIADAHLGACFALDEFFGGMIRNRHTRDAYLRAVRHATLC